MNSDHYPFKPKPLPYSFDALAPCVSEQTLTVHYRCHYLKYAEKLNDALKGYPNYWKKSLCSLLSDPAQIPSDVRTAVVRNGGGVFNHELYFGSMTPCRKEIPELLRRRLESAFGSVDEFLKCFSEEGLSVFGSGYAALALSKTGKLDIITFPNQDTEYLSKWVPLLVCDVWEHAYYLQHHSDRAAYLGAFCSLINWSCAAERLEAACLGRT